MTGTGSPRRDREWIRRHLASGARVRVDDISGTEACYCLWGPAAGEILAPPGAPAKDNYYGALITTVSAKVTANQVIASSGGYSGIAQYGGSFAALGASQGRLLGSEVTTGDV